MSSTATPTSPIRASTYAAIHKVHRSQVYRWIRKGKVKGHQIDGVWFV